MERRFTHVEAVAEPRSEHAQHRDDFDRGRARSFAPADEARYETRSYGVPPQRDARSLGDLIKELRDEATILIRQEVALAKTELSEKAAKAGRNAAYAAVGGAIAYAGLIFLLLAVNLLLTWGLIAAGMDRYVAYWVAPLIVGVVTAVIGYALIQKAINTFSHPEKLTPNKTIDSVQENAQWAKHKVTG